MSKVLVIPDIHGSWLQNLKVIRESKDSVDYVVTLGDYVDDWEETANGEPMRDGFLQLVEMARAEPDKFRICLGNHDHAYLTKQPCSGHHHEYAQMYRKMFMDNIDIIRPAVLIDGVLFSHAGVSQVWFNRACCYYNKKHRWDKVPEDVMAEYNKWTYSDSHINEIYFGGRVFSLVNPENEQGKKDLKEYRKIQDCIRNKIDEAFNEVAKYSYEAIRSYAFTVKKLEMIFRDNLDSLGHCGWSSSGDSPGESCLWIRPNSLLRDNWPENIKCQVVGHTEYGLKKWKWNRHKLIICDNHEHDCAFVLDTENIGEFEKVKYKPNPKYNPRLNEALLRALI